MDIKQQYETWLRLAPRSALADPDVTRELEEMKDHPEAVADAFYRDLAFGTGGLRGVIGAGTNRMNVFTVAKASQGLADYICRWAPEGSRRIAVSYDSRIKSDLFARTASGVFAANGIRVLIYPQLMPTPCLSFAVRQLSCAAGIMVTASHNPSKYNGYKVYGPDGCQITSQAADQILEAMETLDLFQDIRFQSFEQGLESGMISYIGQDVYTDFVKAVQSQSLLGDEAIDKQIAIVYSPLNGTGREPVLRTLRESGYRNITVVPEQEMPDGTFPTCPYPNPEIREAMELGIQYARKQGADLLIATDPDCDRVGIAVKNPEGEYVLLSGNETGLLLLDYICSRRQALGRMPKDPVVVKTIVTSDMAQQIAEAYGVGIRNVLTGFKYIGEQIGLLEKEGKADSFIFGFEESYGCLTGSYVRDKDAVDGAFMICEMFAYYASQGICLLDRLHALYSRFGCRRNTLHSYEFEGAAGFEKMQRIMKRFRSGISHLGGKKVVQVLDYAQGLDGLPASDVVKFVLEGNSSVVVRPSGTEPKIKIYLSVCAGDFPEADRQEENLIRDLEQNLHE